METVAVLYKGNKQHPQCPSGFCGVHAARLELYSRRINVGILELLCTFFVSSDIIDYYTQQNR